MYVRCAHACGRQSGGLRRRRAAGRERAARRLPGRGRRGQVPGEAEAREELRPGRDAPQRRRGDDPEHRADRQRPRRAQDSDPDLADPARPVFAINGVQVEIAGFPEAKDASPRGCDTAYVNTWACGPLKPGEREDLPLERDRGRGRRLQDRLARGRRARRQGEGRGGGRRARRRAASSPARSRTRRPTSASPTTARRSSAGPAELAALVAGAALDRQPRVLREALVGPVPQAHREHASARRSGSASGARRCRTGPPSRR